MKRKAVQCALCKNKETKHESGICDQCVLEWQHGRKTLEQQQLPGAAHAHLVNVTELAMAAPTAHRLYREQVKTRDIFHLLRDATEKLLALVNAKPIDRRLVTHNDNELTIGLDCEEMMAARIPRYPTTYAWYVIDDNKAAALNDFSRVLNLLTASAYADGYAEGNSLIVRLASGALTVDQLNKEELRRK